MHEMPPLHTEHLDLEPLRVQHADEIWPQLDDERMWRYFPALRPKTLDDLRRLYEKWSRGSQTQTEVWCNWLCRERASGVLAASMQATVFVRARVFYIAYAVYPLHQRKGYGREGASAVIDYIKAYDVDRAFAEMDTRNEPSYRLAESLGFTRVRTHQKVERGHGIDADEYVYELELQ
jgi:RimJ/RimL family protein N-acetyltransferase